MTPQEKAFKLVIDKYYNLNCISTIEEAKQCALIAVDEMIENDKKNYGTDGFVVNYWEEVKQELQKL